MGNKPRIPQIEQLSDESVAFYDVLTSENDVAAVVTSVAFLDQCVASLLARFFIDGETAKSLLHYRGAVGNFITRAELAYVLGLISKALLNNLRTLAEIRNHFAHSYLAVSFKDQNTIELCRRLTFPEVIGLIQQSERGPLTMAHEWPQSFETDTRLRFVVIATLMSHALFHAGRNIIKRSLQVDGWRLENHIDHPQPGVNSLIPAPMDASGIAPTGRLDR